MILELLNRILKGTTTVVSHYQDLRQNGVASSKGALKLGAFVFVLLLLNFVLLFLYGYGAARLSYCYNRTTGQTEMTAIAYSLLAFFFAAIYYPYYGVFIAPICDAKN